MGSLWLYNFPLKIIKSWYVQLRRKLAIEIYYNGNNMVNCVTYWPSTELSIKRCTCVNKRKNSGSRWTLNNNITRWQMAWVSWSQLGTRCRIEQPQDEKEVLLWLREELWVKITVCPCLQLISHTQPTSTLSR